MGEFPLSGDHRVAGARASLADQVERERIGTRLDVNILVEAGAGSGKTTALTDRMVALILSGTAVIEEIAAVRRSNGSPRSPSPGRPRRSYESASRPRSRRGSVHARPKGASMTV